MKCQIFGKLRVISKVHYRTSTRKRFPNECRKIILIFCYERLEMGKIKIQGKVRKQEESVKSRVSFQEKKWPSCIYTLISASSIKSR